MPKESTQFVLFVEHSEKYISPVIAALNQSENKKFTLHHAPSIEKAFEMAKEVSFDIILLSLDLPGYFGEDLYLRVVSQIPHVPVVVFLEHYNASLLSQLMRRGVQDCLLKNDLQSMPLARILQHAINRFRLTKIKSQFLTDVSHELQVPLNNFISYADLLQESKLTALQQNFLDSMMISFENLLAMLYSMIEIANAESGHFESYSHVFHLYSLVFTVIKTIQEKNPSIEIITLFDTESDLPRYLKGNPSHLKQVLKELLKTAISITESKALILTVQKGSEDLENDYVKLDFSIKDAALDEPQKKQGKEIKLGLSTAKTFIALMGGASPSFSKVETGAQFYFSLVFKKSLSEEDNTQIQIQKTLPKQENAHPCVLLAEDNLITQKLVKAIFETLPYDLDIAQNGQEACEKVANKEYSLCLMDIHMPIMNGIQATHYIRDNLSQTLPIIAFTSTVLIEHKHLCLDAGMNDFVVKPFKSEDLRQLIQKWCESASSLL